MERLNEYLRNLSIESLMSLSRDSESLTFEENSIIRHLISEYGISSDFHTGLVGLRSILLTEITRRYFSLYQLKQHLENKGFQIKIH